MCPTCPTLIDYIQSSEMSRHTARRSTVPVLRNGFREVIDTGLWDFVPAERRLTGFRRTGERIKDTLVMQLCTALTDAQGGHFCGWPDHEPLGPISQPATQARGEQ